MEKVIGIGGVFLKAKNPAAMAAWYETHLGVAFSGNTYAILNANENENPITVFSFFPQDTTYFAPSNSSVMLNFRVKNLNAMLEQLKNAGIEVLPESSNDENGQFAWILDPEGNKIELWQAANAS